MRYGTLDFNGFDWDDGNILKIQVRLAIDKVEIFFKQKLLIKKDNRHSFSEERWIAIGGSEDGRCLLVAYTMRKKGSETLLRPISARFTHKKEREAYEEIKKVLLQEE